MEVKTGKQLSSETFPKSSSGNVKSALIMLSNSSGMFSLRKTGMFQSLDERTLIKLDVHQQTQK